MNIVELNIVNNFVECIAFQLEVILNYRLLIIRFLYEKNVVFNYKSSLL